MTVKVTADQVAAMRAFLTGEGKQFRRIIDRFDNGAKTGYSALIIASFIEAVGERFGKGASKADVAEFVADLRVRSERLASEIDPEQAERLIRAVHTDEEIDDIDDGLYGPLTARMIADLQLSDEELDEFLEKARRLANELLEPEP